MANNADQVDVAATGAVYMSTIGATAPTNATAAWSTAWKELGFLSEDGLTENQGLDSEEIKAWQNGAVVRRVITGSRMELAFTPIETNLQTLDLFYPGSVTTQVTGPPAETQTIIKLPVATPKAFGIDVIDGTKRLRVIVAKAEVADRGEVSYLNSAPVSYPVTLNVTPSTANELATKLHNPQVA
jgi:hypothetical protein